MAAEAAENNTLKERSACSRNPAGFQGGIVGLVIAEDLLIEEEAVPGDIADEMLFDQDLPLFHRPESAFLPEWDVAFGAATEGIGSGIKRVMQNTQDPTMRQRNPSGGTVHSARRFSTGKE